MIKRTEKREREARRANYPEYDHLTLDQLFSERKSVGLQIEDLGRQIKDLALRSVNLKIRIRAAKDGDSGIGISDHAVVRYLERVKGVDLAAVRAEIRAHVASRDLDGSRDQIIESDGVSFAVYDGNRLATVWKEPSDDKIDLDGRESIRRAPLGGS